jgi:hypothetical protein
VGVTWIHFLANKLTRFPSYDRFSLKFRKIVHDEQDGNFISRLHGNSLIIMPWPVIESKDFYRCFSALKVQLDEQEITHKTAGEFLLTVKTLMAKLKVSFVKALV